MTIVTLTVIFASIRFSALFGDLWMDEIWTVKKVREFSTAGQVFTDFFEANNHPLSSLWIYLLTPTKVDWLYRLLSFGSGIAALVIAVAIVVDRTRHLDPSVTSARLRLLAVVSTVLFGSCYFLIVYSSEARGYAPALAFSLLGYLILLRNQWRLAPLPIAFYTLSCVLALLSHAAAMQVILAAVVWSAVSSIKRGEGLRRMLLRLVVWHIFPITSCGFYIVHFLWGINVGGAPEIDRYYMLSELVAYTVGLPSTRIAGFLLPLGVVAVLVALYRLGRRSLPDAMLFGLVILSPLACAVVMGDSIVLFARYFIFSVAWSLILAAMSLGEVRRQPVLIVSGVLLAGFVLGNARHIQFLLRHGRGEYQSTLRYLAEQTPSGEITICSDHDYRNFMLLEHFFRRAAPGRIVRYLAANHKTGLSPRWLLVHRLDGYPVPSPQLYDDKGNLFRFDRLFPHAPLSGWDWYVYRNANEL